MTLLTRKGAVGPEHITSLSNEVRKIDKSQILNGTLVEGVEVTSNRRNRIRHSLGRSPVGWFVVMNPQASITFYDEQGVNPRTDLELWLYPGESAGPNTFKISLWVF